MSMLLKKSSKEKLVIFLPGYKESGTELSFLSDFIIHEKNFSFFSVPYLLEKKTGEINSISEIILGIEKGIKILLDDHHFSKCYLFGYSLGAALAMGLSKEILIKFDKLILLSIFDDRRELLKLRGISINDRENISPIKLAEKNKEIPKTFIHGTKDTSIPIERARAVFNNCLAVNSSFISLEVTHYFRDKKSQQLLLEAINSSL